jgi:hypothetical protein
MTFLSRSIRRLPWLLVLALGAGACSQSDNAPRLQNEGVSVSGRKPSSPEEEWTRAPDEVCDPRDQAIRKWVDGFRHCERHEDCAVTEIAAGCADAFLCPTVLSVNIDRAAFEREAAAKQAEYEPECGCAIADCSAPWQMTPYCEPTTKLCGAKYGCVILGGHVICNTDVSPDLEASILNAANADAATKDVSAQDAGAGSD